MKQLPGWLRQHLAALRALVAFTVVVGIAYPLAITAVAQVVAPGPANGSVVSVDGKDVGSSLLGQSFSDAHGNPLPQWFQPRPSATAYDASTSGASNLGPENPTLIAAIKKLRADVAQFNSVAGHPVDPTSVPADAVTASASGLDPDISAAYARLQVYRVADARRLDPSVVLGLVTKHTDGVSSGAFGGRVVNVLELNIALSELG